MLCCHFLVIALSFAELLFIDKNNTQQLNESETNDY